MEDYDDLLSDDSFNEDADYSDQVDSDIENELYALIHHGPQDNSISLQDESVSIDIKPVSLQDTFSSTGNNSVLSQNNLILSGDNSVLSQTNFVASENTLNSTKNQENSVKKNSQNYNSLITTNHTNFFSSDIIPDSNLYFSFESPIKKQKNQRSQVQSKNSKRNTVLTPAKRKSDVVSAILGNIQLKKNMKSKNSDSKQNKKNSVHKSIITEAESFVVIDDSSDSDSSIIFLEPDKLNLQTNITKETVVLSSDSENSDSSMEKSFSEACRKKQTEISNADANPNNKDMWHINSEDKFRTKKQSNRYHENAVVTCSKCQLKGHSAKFCSVPKAVKCFFCGDYHSGMKCRNKICIKCFQQGHDRRHCYMRFIHTCKLCCMMGHSEGNCPDIWRRYHLTTSTGSIIKGNPNPHSPLFCYSCGSKGHYGAECMETRTDRWSFPTWTSVISYEKPTSALWKENRKNLYQERNSYERSRFDSTPLFHRRKGKYSKDPPTQNTKKKKKKKSSKMLPNTNQQFTPKVKTIVQNEVYFPRTPKRKTNLSPESFLKKKFKNKDSLLRQQEVHRIGLQQRLGLPLSSTV